MRGVIFSLAVASTIVGCAQVYTSTSKNPALVRMPPSDAFRARDHISLVAIDGISVDTRVTDDNRQRLDPGTRQLTFTYEASRKIVGARVAASPLVLKARFGAGTKYQVICESSDVGVKMFVRQESNGRIVSNTAESSLMPAPATYPSPPQLFQTPAVRHH